jgi:putative DNA primase/helicase
VSIDVDGLKRDNDIVSVVAAFVELKKRGAEYVGLCPFHSDNNPSFWVSPVKQFAHCFSCDVHHDVISFVQAMEGLDFKGACERLGAKVEWRPIAPVQAASRKPMPERITSKPPPESPTPQMKVGTLGDPTRVYPIRDLDGSLIAYECRYEPPTGGKEMRIWSWGTRGDRPAGWGIGALNVPRPLYGLERIGLHPKLAVLVTEGPKKADAGHRLLAQYYASVSWTGGANSWHKHDWKPLAGKQVLVCPDNDKTGIEAAEKLAALLTDPRGLACEVKIVDPNRMPESWDIADWEGTGAELIEWAKPRARLYKAPEPVKAKPPQLSVVVGNTVRTIEPKEEAEAAPIAMSEDMMADRFADVHGGRWRFVKPWGSWFEWRGDGWYRDDTAMVDRLAVELVRQAVYWPEAANLSAAEKRRIPSRRVAGAVRDCASNDRRIAATIDQWDTEMWLLGVPGGVVDLRTSQSLEPRPDQYITKRTAIAPADGDAPIWRQFLETVTNGSDDLIEFLQRFAGYAMTGETREQCLAFLYGTGQNGKGVFITTLAKILGDYASTADADVFMESDQQRHPTEMARLRGARLVTVDETDGTKRWNEKRIKRITGGGKIEARFMRQDDFEYMPQFKLLLAGNHKPQLRGVGKAIQRRIHLVPFTVTIPDHSRDNKLTQKLEAEYPQILRWMIEGCAMWQASGLNAPQVVTDATSHYIEAEDVIGEWIEERTEQSGTCERPAAYKNYRGWVEGRGERAWSSKAFWSALEERGFTARKSSGTWYINNLTMKLGAAAEDQNQHRY